MLKKTLMLLFGISTLFANTIIYNANIYTVDEILTIKVLQTFLKEKSIYEEH